VLFLLWQIESSQSEFLVHQKKETTVADPNKLDTVWKSHGVDHHCVDTREAGETDKDFAKRHGDHIISDLDTFPIDHT